MKPIYRYPSAFTKASLGLSMLASTACVSAAVLPSAQMWNTTSAEIDVQGLAIQLIDLDANDGITPQIMFADDRMSLNVYGTTNDSVFFQSEIRPANTSFPLSNGNIDLSNPDGSSVARMSTSGLYAGTGSSEDLISQNALIEPGSDHYSGTGTGFSSPTDWRSNALSYSYNNSRRLFGYGASDGMLLTTNNSYYQLNTDPAQPGFSVTPNTAVVFSGTLSSRVRIDLSQLSKYDPQTTQALALAYGSVDLFSAAPNDGNTDWNSYQSAMSALEAQTVGVYADVRRFNYTLDRPFAGFVGPESTQVEMEDTKPFSMTFTNNTLQSKEGYFSVRVQSEMAVAGLLSVPEPGSYALMGLGLLGVAGAVRRRKA